MTQQIRCSGCGGSHAIDEAFARVFACSYCGLVSKVTGTSLTAVGQSTKLAASQGLFSIGMRGTYLTEAFMVAGRIHPRAHRAPGVARPAPDGASEAPCLGLRRARRRRRNMRDRRLEPDMAPPGAGSESGRPSGIGGDQPSLDGAAGRIISPALLATGDKIPVPAVDRSPYDCRRPNDDAALARERQDLCPTVSRPRRPGSDAESSGSLDRKGNSAARSDSVACRIGRNDSAQRRNRGTVVSRARLFGHRYRPFPCHCRTRWRDAVARRDMAT